MLRGQHHYAKRPAFTVTEGTGIGLTMQGKDTGVRESIQRLSAGTLLERTGHYYDDQFHFPDEDLPIDVSLLDKVQLLELHRAKTLQLEQFIIDNPPVIPPVIPEP